jgi:transcriptional regulator with XRE-family HTH domain
MTPAALIRAVRRRNGLTQAELARRAGTSQPVISAYERGVRDPTVGTLRRLVEAAGERLEISARPSGSGIPPATTLEARARRLLDALSVADAVPPRRRSRRLQAPRLVSR